MPQVRFLAGKFLWRTGAVGCQEALRCLAKLTALLPPPCIAAHDATCRPLYSGATSLPLVMAAVCKGAEAAVLDFWQRASTYRGRSYTQALWH